MRVGGQAVALRDRRRQRPRAAHAHGQVPGACRGRRDLRRLAARARRRSAVPARDLHGSRRRRRRPHARERAGGGDRCARRRPRHVRDGRRELPRTQRMRHDALRARRRSASCSSARRSSVPTSPSCCTRRRSRSSPRCRWRRSSTPCRRSRRAASCGSTCAAGTERARAGLHTDPTGSPVVRRGDANPMSTCEPGGAARAGGVVEMRVLALDPAGGSRACCAGIDGVRATVETRARRPARVRRDSPRVRRRRARAA